LALGAAAARTVGDLTIVGIAGGTLAVSFFSVPYELSIQTSYWGSRPELVQVLELAARGLVHAKVATFDLDRAGDAYRAMEAGELQGRAVITPTPA
jgi:propanol-preferring alcohol dehydrogenase